VPAELADTDTGVFTVAMNDDYTILARQQGIAGITPHTLTGLHRSMLANRLSYTLGLHGPSLTLDSGQSAGLVAVHLACESLRRGEAALALVAGVNLICAPESTAAVTIAAVNGPQATVLSGDEDDVLRLADRMRAVGHRVRRLRVSHAFHSAHMEPMLAEFRRIAQALSFSAPRIPVLSNVTGRPADPAEICSADYWVRHVRQGVRFGDSVRWLGEQGVGAYLELGPGGTLAALGRQSADGVFVSLLRGTAGGDDRAAEERAAVSALGRLHAAGVAVDWRRFFAKWPVHPVDLPGYAFARERHWLDTVDGPVTADGLVPFAQRLAGLSAADTDRMLVDLVRRHAAAVLGHASPDALRLDRTFRDAGLDSLLAVELRDRLCSATGLSLEPAVLFNHPTVPAMARQLRESLRGRPTVVVEPARANIGDDPIAVVGVGCRFPGGVGSLADLWDLVVSGTDAVGDFPGDRRWDDDLFDPDPDAAGRSYTRAGGFLAPRCRSRPHLSSTGSGT
jgi:acyl transferase domain-containing protein